MAPKLTAAVAGGDLRASLEALRDQLAAEIDEGVLCKSCGGPVTSPTAPLAKQLQDVLVRLAALPSGEEKSIADELADRRAARNQGAQASKRAQGQKRAGGGRRRSGGPRRAGS